MKSNHIKLTSLLVSILGVTGCLAPQSTSVFALPQFVRNHHRTVTDISAQPSGILIRVLPQTVSLTNIVSHVRIVPGEGRQMPQLTFDLNNVTPGPAVPLDKVMQVWNQTLYSIEVHERDKELRVSVSFEGLFNRAVIGTSPSGYLGISLAVGAGHLPPPNHHAVVPLWYLRDLLVANHLQFKPTSSTGYSYMLPSKPVDKWDMLAAPYRGKQEVLGYGSYFGAIPIGDLYKGLDIARVNGEISIRRGTVLERMDGKAAHVPAVLLGMPNSWSFGFAHNQIIIASEHAGIVGYTVYNAPGISVP